jgi:hypothetical protein
MGLAPSLGNGWVRFQPAPSRKVGQISTGVDSSELFKRFPWTKIQLAILFGDRFVV